MSIQFIRTTKEGQQTLPADYSDSFVFITDDNSREFTVGGKEYHCLTNEEREKFDTFVTFEDVEKSEAVASAALNDLNQRVSELDNKCGSMTVPTNISELTNDAGYITSEAITGKQDNIADLDTIRANAALGATALQTIPDEYVTETELEAKGYLTSHQDISGKANVSDLTSHTNNSNIHVTTTDKSKWNAAEQNAKSYADGLNTAMDARVAANTTNIGVTEKPLADRITNLENSIIPDARASVLWLGTSIPAGDIQYDNNGTTDYGTNNYPKMVADALGFNLYNNSRPGSFMFCYPVNSEIANNLSSWSTADEVDNMGFVFGYSLTQTHADVETIFRNKLNSLRSAARRPQSWVDNHIADFKAHSYESLVIPYIDGTIASCDTVIIDHGFNDRDNIWNTCQSHRNDTDDNYSYWPESVAGAANITYPVTDGNVGWDWLTHLSDPRSYDGIEWMKALRNLARSKNGDFRTDYFGAMAWLIERILEVNPRIKIIFGNYFSQQYSMTLDNMGSFRTKYLLEANEQLAKFYGCQCINPYKYTGLRGETIVTLDGTSYEDVTLFCPDGVHPHSDSTGHANRVIAGVYINQLRGILNT